MTSQPDWRDADAERVFLRRGFAMIGFAALVTIPLANLAQMSGVAWIPGANAILSVVLVLGVIQNRVPAAWPVAVGGVGLYVVALISFQAALGDVVAGTSLPVGLGSSALWAAAVVSPLTFVILRPRLAAALNLLALLAFPAATLVRHGSTGLATAREAGAFEPIVAGVVCVAGSMAVAVHVLRLQRQQRAAQQAAKEAGRRVLSLADQRRARRTGFEGAALLLTSSVDVLCRQVALLEQQGTGDTSGDSTELLLQGIAGTVAEIREAADSTLAERRRLLTEDGSPDLSVTQGAAGGPPRALQAGQFASLTAVLALTAIDASALAGRLASGHGAAAQIAVAGNRMLVVLVVAAAIAVLALPRAVAAVAVVFAGLMHPLALGLSLAAGTDITRDVLARLVAPWRLAVIAAGLLLCMATLIRMRERERDRAREREVLATEAARQIMTDESRHQQESAEVAHELQTPLTVLQGTVSTLLRNQANLTPEMAQELRAGVVRATGRLQARAAALVAAAADEPLEPARHDAARLPASGILLQAAAATEPALGGRQLDVRILVGDAHVRVAPEHLEHVLENLLSNAHKYGTDRRVALDATVVGAEVHVTVTNGGGGLSPEDATHVFDPWFRAAGADDHARGTGLGLTVVHRLVEAWGGRAWCHVPDGRTIVGFSIPVDGPGNRAPGPVVALRPVDQAPAT